jgi:hypothetical protein
MRTSEILPIFYNTHTTSFLRILTIDLQSVVIDISDTRDTVFRVLSSKQRDLQSTMLNCYAQIVKFLFALSSYLTENTVCLDYKDQSRRCINVSRSSCEVSVISPHINQYRKVSTNFRKNTKYEISRKFVQWVSHADRRRDMTSLEVTCCNCLAKDTKRKQHRVCQILWGNTRRGTSDTK